MKKIIPLGPESAREIKTKIQSEYPRRKNWNPPAAVCSISPAHCVTIDNGRYSSRCTFKHYTYTPAVCSVARIDDGDLIFWWADNQPIKLSPPAHYTWECDLGGIRIVAISTQDKDYHVNSDDLRSYSKSAVRQKAIAAYNQRLIVKKQARETMAAIRHAEREGATVCVADSKRAGNCLTGTLNFARRHNLDPSGHYAPTKLLTITDGEDSSRVRLAVAVALRRHRQEMARGYALLAEHRI